MVDKEDFNSLLFELEDVSTSNTRRLEIGQRLDALGDQRKGVGVINGVPEIAWLPIPEKGTVSIWRSTHSKPVATFDIEPFYISKYCVTYEQYQAFVQANDGFSQHAWWEEFPIDYQKQTLANQYIAQGNNPQDSISWYQAVAFSRWVTDLMMGLKLPNPLSGDDFVIGQNVEIRLPTEGEWQWAAQNGREERPFPWGSDPLGYANTAESGLGKGTAVGMYPHGAAACGALDMGGNVMEWCLTDKIKIGHVAFNSNRSKVLHGGDWGYQIENASTRYCDDEPPHTVDPLNGFRLVVGQKLI